MLTKSIILKHYKRKDIQQALIQHAQHKEIGMQYGQGFGKRPDILQYPRDVIELALRGVTSFHASEERWSNPLSLSSSITKKELDELRTGWDLVLDIDCQIFEYSRICADLIVKFLNYCGVEDVSCKFSVTGDTPILVRMNGIINLLPIKNVIGLLKNKIGSEVLSLNKEGNVCFSKILGYLEHKEPIYEIYYENSKLPVKATKHHSLFTWNKGNILQKKVEDLREGSYLVTFRGSHNIQRYVGFFEWEYTFLNKKVIKKIKVTKELMLLLGYYLSEGHITKTIHQIGFSFNANEREYINECIYLLKQITGRHISIRNPSQNATQVLIHSKEWYYFFHNVCGRGAKNKHIPSFAWKLPKNYFLELLKGYINGDGYKVGPYSITIKSVSHQLIREFVWLCKLNGIPCSLNQEYSEEHILPQGTLFKGSHVYTINIPKSELEAIGFLRERNKYSPHPKGRTIPVDGLKEVYKQIKPKLFNRYRAEQMTLHKEFANLHRIQKVLNWFEETKVEDYTNESRTIIDNYKKLFTNDVVVLRVQNIKKKEKESVYDISVEDTERFFGGEFPVLLHNSGNKGFHIGVPFEAFPKKVGETLTKDLFPEAAKKIAFYVKENIKEELGKRIIAFERDDFTAVRKKVDLPQEILIRYEHTNLGDKIPKLDAEKFLEIDTILIAPRHLYRMPYSLHEKSGLVSLPIDSRSVMKFEKEMARPERILEPIFSFLARNVAGESARRLLVQALDFEVKIEDERKETKEDYEEITFESPITEEFFPPCIGLMLQGLEDGRKRAVFCLMNFLGKIGWGKEEIKEELMQWREKNREPLREVYVKGQLNHFTPGSRLPPSCTNEAYYSGIGVCKPEQLCQKIKNPVNYTILKWKRWLREKENSK